MTDLDLAVADILIDTAFDEPDTRAIAELLERRDEPVSPQLEYYGEDVLELVSRFQHFVMWLSLAGVGVAFLWMAVTR